MKQSYLKIYDNKKYYMLMTKVFTFFGRLCSAIPISSSGASRSLVFKLLFAILAVSWSGNAKALTITSSHTSCTVTALDCGNKWQVTTSQYVVFNVSDGTVSSFVSADASYNVSTNVWGGYGICTSNNEYTAYQFSSSTTFYLVYDESTTTLTIQTAVASCGPTLTASTLEAFSSCYDEVSASQEVTLSSPTGFTVDEVITITAPEGFEVCTTENGTYASTTTITATNATTLNYSSFYVRMKDLTASPTAGNVTLTTSSGLNVNVAVSGTVHRASLTASTLTAFSSCSGVASEPQTVTLSDPSYFVADENISILAPTGFEVSLNGTNYGDLIYIQSTGAETLSQNYFYVRMAATSEAPSDGSISIYNDRLSSVNVNVSGSLKSSAECDPAINITCPDDMDFGEQYYGVEVADSDAKEVTFSVVNYTGSNGFSVTSSGFLKFSKTRDGEYSLDLEYTNAEIASSQTFYVKPVVDNLTDIDRNDYISIYEEIIPTSLSNQCGAWSYSIDKMKIQFSCLSDDDADFGEYYAGYSFTNSDAKQINFVVRNYDDNVQDVVLSVEGTDFVISKTQDGTYSQSLTFSTSTANTNTEIPVWIKPNNTTPNNDYYTSSITANSSAYYTSGSCTNFKYKVNVPTITPSCPSSITKGTEQQLSLTVDVPSSSYVKISSTNSDLKFSVGTGASSGTNLLVVPYSDINNVYVAYTGTEDADDVPVTFELCTDASGSTLYTYNTNQNVTANCSINCTVWTPSVLCRSYFVNDDIAVTYDSETKVGYVDITLKTTSVYNPANSTEKYYQIGWGAVQLDVSGLGVTTQTSLPNTINGSAGLYCGYGDNGTNDGAVYYCVNNNSAGSGALSKPAADFESSTGGKKYWSCDGTVSCGTLGYFRIDDNGDNRGGGQNESGSKYTPIHETHRVYFYVDQSNPTNLYYAFDYMPTVTLSVNKCQSSAGESVTITATVENMVASAGLTYTLYKVGTDDAVATNSNVQSLTSTFNVTAAGEYYVVVNGKQKQTEIQNPAGSEQSGNRLTVARTSDNIKVGLCEGVTGTITSNKTEYCESEPGVTINVSDIEVTNPNSGTVTYQWQTKASSESTWTNVGATTNYSDNTLQLTPSTLSGDVDYRVLFKIGDNEYPTDAVSLEALPTTLTTSVESLTYTGNQTEATVTVNKLCGMCSLPVSVEGDGTVTFAVSSSNINPCNGDVTITVTITNDDLEDGDYSGNLYIGEKGGSNTKTIPITVNRVNCTQTEICNITFSNGSNNPFGITIANDCQFSSGFYESSITVPVGSYRVQGTRCHGDWGKSEINIYVGEDNNLGTFKSAANTSTFTDLIINVAEAGYLNLSCTNQAYLSTLVITSVCPPSFAIGLTGDPCTTNTATLTATVDGSSTYSYSWSTTGGEILSGDGTSVITIGKGTASYTCTVTDTETELSTTKTYNVYCAPEIKSISAQEFAICPNNVSPETADLTVTYNNYTGFNVTGLKVYNSSNVEVGSKDLDVTTAQEDAEATIEDISLAAAGTYSVKLTYKESGSDDVKYTDATTFAVKAKQFCGDNISLSTNCVSLCSGTGTVNATVTLSGSDYSGYSVKVYSDSECNTEVSSDDISVSGTTLTINKSAAKTKAGFATMYYVRAESNATGDSSKSEIESFRVIEIPFCENPTLVAQVDKVDVCPGDVITVSIADKTNFNADYTDVTYTLHMNDVENDVIGERNSTGTFSYTVTGDEGSSFNFYINAHGQYNDGALNVVTAPGTTPSATVYSSTMCGMSIAFDGSDQTVCRQENQTITIPFTITGKQDDVTYTYTIKKNDVAVLEDQAVSISTNSTNVTSPAIELSAGENVFVIELKGVNNTTSHVSTITTTTSLTITQKPAVTISSISNSLGNDLTTCEAGNISATVSAPLALVDESFHYVWKKNNTNVSSGDVTCATAGVLTIPSVDGVIISEATTYSLEVTGGCETATRNQEFTPAACEKIGISLGVHEGYCDGEATISVTAEDGVSLNNFTYTWYNKEGSVWTEMDGETSSSLTLSGLTGDTNPYKVEVRRGDVIVYSNDAINVGPGVGCEVDYFVRDNVTNSGNGSDWGDASAAGEDGAFKTLDEALAAAVTVHTADPDKKVNIYVATESSSAYTVSDDDDQNVLKNTLIYGGFASSTHTSGTKTDDASGYTSVSASSTAFKASTGTNKLSHLKFDGVSGTTRVIASAGNNEYENLVIDSCYFTNNSGGAVKLNSTGGGELTIYSTIFDGNNAYSGSASRDNGWALYIEGPYEVNITSKEGTSRPSTTNLTRDWGDRSCSTKKTMTVSLLDSTTVGNCQNKFINHTPGTTTTLSYNMIGQVVHIDGASYVLIDNSLFSDNLNRNNNPVHGCCVSVENSSTLEIKYSFFVNNEINGSQELSGTTGVGVYVTNVANAEYRYLWFSDNALSNKGRGAAFASLGSNVNIYNTYMGYNTVKTGNAGAMYTSDASLVSIEDSYFLSNKITSGSGICGAAYVSDAAVNVSYSIFEANDAGQVGGGFYARSSENNTSYDASNLIHVLNCLFLSNKTKDGTGHAPAIQAIGSKIEIEKCEFYDNEMAESNSACVGFQNCYSTILQSSFIGNTCKMQNQGCAAVFSTGNYTTAGTKNCFIYNCTFAKNEGAQYGIICAKDGSYIDITSCTIVDNEKNANANVITKDGSNAYFDLFNCIVSNNEHDQTKLKTNASNFAYNTIGTTIYFDENGESASTSELGCDPDYTGSGSLMSYCSYGPLYVSTKPFEDETCRMYGASRSELMAHAAAANSTIISEQALLDEHDAPRGWHNLTGDVTDFTSEMRTYQGAVEGGTSIYEGKKFQMTINSMPTLCVGGQKSDAYIKITLTSLTKEVNGVDTFVLSNSDFASTDFRLTTYKISGTDTTLVATACPITNIDSVSPGVSSITLNGSKYSTGSYEIVVTRLGTPNEVYKKIAELPEKGLATAIAWVGGSSTDYNDLNNWVIVEDGKITNTTATEALVGDSKPSACQDIYVSLYNLGSGTDVSNYSVNGKSKVSNLPSIQSDDEEGQCANVYFLQNGSIGQIQKLNYNGAYVDLALNSYTGNGSGKSGLNWSVLAAPLKEFYSGDLYNADFGSYIRYLNVEEDSKGDYKVTWSNSINTLDVPLYKGLTGFAFRYYVKAKNGHTLYQDSINIYHFPNDETDYVYYSAVSGEATGEKSTLSKTDARHRFITENSKNAFVSPWTETVDLTNRAGLNLLTNETFSASLDDANGFVAIANPYMSHIDLDAFYADNSDLINPTIKVFDHASQTFVTYNASSKESSSMNKYVAPMQSFFVQPKTLASKLNIVFNAENISVVPATNLDYISLRDNTLEVDKLTITGNTNSYSHSSYISAGAGASAKFNSNEDIQTLFSETANITVYTKAGDVSVDLNKLDVDSLDDVCVPVCVQLYKAGNVTFTISGMNAFEDADEIFWCDASNSSRTSLAEQNTFTVNGLSKGKNEGRFSICFKQKARVKKNISDTVCQGDAYSFNGKNISTENSGASTTRLVKYVDDELKSDTAYYVNLQVNPTYKTVIKDTISEGDDYKANGFNYPAASTSAGSIADTLYLQSASGCDSTVILNLLVKPSTYKALVYNGKNKSEVWVKADGSNLNLSGNALAYFAEGAPESLCGMTNVICKNGSSFEATKVVLVDSADLYIPFHFTADSIIFTRKPAMFATRNGGWETIVLPFSTTKICNSGSADGVPAKSIVPFNKADELAYGDFWMKVFADSKVDAIGFDYPQTPEILANTPYIVAYPGITYGKENSFEGQTISYIGVGCLVSETTYQIGNDLGNFSVYGTFEKESVEDAYLLNISENMFIKEDTAVVNPFTCYISSESFSSVRSLSIYDVSDDDDEILTGSDKLSANGPAHLVVFVEDNTIYVSSNAAGVVDVRSLDSKEVIRTVSYGVGTTKVGTLVAGAYLVGNVKVILK